MKKLLKSIIRPKFLRDLDSNLLKKHPRLWNMEIIHVIWHVLLFLPLTFFTFSYFNKLYNADSLYKVVLLFIILEFGYFIYWFIKLNNHNADKQYGKLKTKLGIFNSLNYGAIIVLIFLSSFIISLLLQDGLEKKVSQADIEQDYAILTFNRIHFKNSNIFEKSYTTLDEYKKIRNSWKTDSTKLYNEERTVGYPYKSKYCNLENLEKLFNEFDKDSLIQIPYQINEFRRLISNVYKNEVQEKSLIGGINSEYGDQRLIDAANLLNTLDNYDKEIALKVFKTFSSYSYEIFLKKSKKRAIDSIRIFNSRQSIVHKNLNAIEFSDSITNYLQEFYKSYVDSAISYEIIKKYTGLQINSINEAKKHIEKAIENICLVREITYKKFNETNYKPINYFWIAHLFLICLLLSFVFILRNVNLDDIKSDKMKFSLWSILYIGIPILIYIYFGDWIEKHLLKDKYAVIFLLLGTINFIAVVTVIKAQIKPEFSILKLVSLCLFTLISPLSLVYFFVLFEYFTLFQALLIGFVTSLILITFLKPIFIKLLSIPK